MWVTYVGLALLAAVCVFAWFKGEMAERLGCGIYCLAWVIALLAEWQAGEAFPVAAVLTLDALAATGFLALAIRYNNLWLGAAMMLQGTQLGLHAMALTGSTDFVIAGFYASALMLNLISFLILVTIAGGVAASAAKRRRRDEQASLAQSSPRPYAASPAN